MRKRTDLCKIVKTKTAQDASTSLAVDGGNALGSNSIYHLVDKVNNQCILAEVYFYLLSEDWGQP
jgi:hypothetical protein